MWPSTLREGQNGVRGLRVGLDLKSLDFMLSMLRNDLQ